MMKFSTTWAALCGLIIGGSAQAVVIDIDNGELGRLIAKGVPIIDIRTAAEWRQSGVIPGSHLLTFFDEQGRADPASWLDKARAIAKPSDPLIVVCRSGNRTKMLSQFLSDQAGYAKVYNVRSGVIAWAREGGALQPLPQQHSQAQSTTGQH